MSEFPSRTYLNHYYSDLGHENRAVVTALIDGVRQLKSESAKVLDIGCGPSLLASFAVVAASPDPPDEVTFLDYRDENLDEIRAWLDEDPSAFDYEKVLAAVAEIAGTTPELIAERLRGAKHNYRKHDMREGLPDELAQSAILVISHFFSEAATNDTDEFCFLLREIARAGQPGATLGLSFIRNSKSFELEGWKFDLVAVDEHSIPGHLDRAEVHLNPVIISSIDAEDPPMREGYEGMVFTYGKLAS